MGGGLGNVARERINHGRPCAGNAGRSVPYKTPLFKHSSIGGWPRENCAGELSVSTIFLFFVDNPSARVSLGTGTALVFYNFYNFRLSGQMTITGLGAASQNSKLLS
ncbi:hypothetical protein A2531_06050 [Candidatus Falkowbacteria bacterium RIFOXYD2_FULL_34_120]|uniref:Uncharacterized protein n=1 Tax=Candidatus Falkowbacteria bacterium RIFOXYD2_FULL_34_120 TaxID=1798007 RepID=A0A1F5TRV5_9BACT|nr:MAG: hypothetical protein A2500_00345 [Candidatus Falkowbacteria bacterium RIFOXYC12_FULL_34_55]OGF37426.1 MAG: hypothetical protein A2466_00375 [Candidatus Falkowbacteria bacterium RIFOXYC2_FULL_34_220]OGF39151.1 MAG: hypothetical protein A2515_00330 [Candidatus Falkowbacteria bacterium RIFOXYD12_FULL_34_57]OGF41700.1 MAG: hypothetical protein A2531_06050 [Candidatus Falkowbacteria bacterium RIFOXYD2_FULL_34_120]